MLKKNLPVRFTGQHFTIDRMLIEQAIKVANINKNDTVLDIGAGKGFLTVHLARKGFDIIAIENDKRLAAHLKRRFSGLSKVKVIETDIRKFVFPQFQFKVVSNIPFALTSDILKGLMYDNAEYFKGGSIITQLEPARKLFLDKMFNPYAVIYHTFFNLKIIDEIDPESFLPPPTVRSALLKIEKKEQAMDADLKDRYRDFISWFLRKPELPVKTALKTIFRKKQVRLLSETYGVNLDTQVACLFASEWEKCFLEMLKVVPERYHP